MSRNDNGCKIVITGMGSVNPLGDLIDSSFNNLINGDLYPLNQVDKIKRFDFSSFPSHIAFHVNDEIISRMQNKYFSAISTLNDLFLLHSLETALIDSNLKNRLPYVIYLGAESGLISYENIFRYYKTGEVDSLSYSLRSPNELLKRVVEYIWKDNKNSFSELSKKINIISLACAGSTAAIAYAYQKLKDEIIYRKIRGESVNNLWAIAGGTIAAINPHFLTGFSLLGALSKKNDNPKLASRPFDQNRDGFVLGEGAGIIILESYESACNRGAKIYAEIVGWGAASDAHKMTDPHPEGKGAARAIKNCLKNAQVMPTQIDYINAHGTSTYQNDLLESKAIAQVFQSQSQTQTQTQTQTQNEKSPLISSHKSMIGHLIAASGVVESIFVIKSLQTQKIPANYNLNKLDSEIEKLNLNFVGNKSITSNLNIKYALKNSFAFGGHNYSLLFKRSCNECK
ncbi:MAG: beta-ketoacyl-[acyl-carrier-protein] synthase family protein [Oligoflexia bacterium]|nr:beta-ketoacyl-[acyl-carrier-protein] synthase family protein [Oligoflexia bacterium]